MLLPLCLGLFAFSPSADDTAPAFPQVWLNAGVYSYHFDESKDLRNNNIGFGAELAVTRDHEVLAGTYINSNDERTRYAAYQWRPLHWELAGVHVGGGIVLGAFDGYPNYHDGGWFGPDQPSRDIVRGDLDQRVTHGRLQGGGKAVHLAFGDANNASWV